MVDVSMNHHVFEVKDTKEGGLQLVASLDVEEATIGDQSKTEKREVWSRRLDFLFACVSLSVGLGNVWRFPYLCYKNGGGAFLIPYFMSAIFAGVPIFLLEVSLGQMMSRGGIAAWAICPLMKGIGFASTVTSFLLNTYYNVILAWTLHFLFSSFALELPWTKCGNPWNTPSCSDRQNRNQSVNASVTQFANISAGSSNGSFAVDPVVEYWENRVLQLSGGVDEMGTVVWQLALCLLLAWVIVYICIFKGIKSSGKIMYATATMPYVFLVILLVKSATLSGAGDGISYYLLPSWNKLSDLTVWSDAGTQIFFSYSISLGSLTALGSYNVFHHNSFRDCIAFASVNTFTSLLAGFVIFATLGHMSLTTGIPIDEVAESGPGLAFVVYPKALGLLEGAPFWSVCFFIMIMLLGIDSQFAGVEGFVTAITDFYPWLIINAKNRAIFVGVVCCVCYLIALPMVMQGGMYVFQLFDNYAGSRIILLTAFFECITVGYLYGAKRFSRNMRTMHGWGLWPTIGAFWLVISPLFSLIMFVISVMVYERLTYKRASQETLYQFPDWAVNTGWLLASISVIMIPIVMAVQIVKTPGTLCERLKTLITPDFTEKQAQRLAEDNQGLPNESQMLYANQSSQKPPNGSTPGSTTNNNNTKSNSIQPVTEINGKQSAVTIVYNSDRMYT